MFNDLAYHRIRDFVQSFIRDTLNAEWDYTRMEWQSRRVKHAHGCARLKDCPNMQGLSNAVIRGHVAGLCLLQSNGDEPSGDDTQRGQRVKRSPEELQADIKEGERAKREMVLYAEWLITAESPDPLKTPDGASVHVIPPHEKYKRPENRPHPSSVRCVDVPAEDYEIDRGCLLNTNFRHTAHSHATCLRPPPAKRQRIAAAAAERETGEKPKCGLPECRFCFPKRLLEASEVEVETFGKDKYRVVVHIKRNDQLLNQGNRTQQDYWRANCDLQIIFDPVTVTHYMVKYSMKCEKSSIAGAKMMKTVMTGLDEVGTIIQANASAVRC
jgi:hypothetical protein